MNPTDDMLIELESWYARSAGQYLLEGVRQCLKDTLDTAFGYHVLQLGITRHQPLFEHSPIHHRIYAAETAGGKVGLLTHGDELPLESDSIDILIAHHSFEFARNPHHVLREMHRVLAPQGHLIVIGFNPFSVSGLAVYCRGLSRRSPWHSHRAVARHRMADWLHLLGCEVQQCNYLYGLPPVGKGRIKQALVTGDQWLQKHNTPMGGIYVLHALKQVARLNRPRRRLIVTPRRLIDLTVPKPRAAPSPTPSVHRRPLEKPGNGDVAV